MPDPLIIFTATDPRILTLTLNRPAKRNALSVALIEALSQEITRATEDKNSRVLILRGAGPVFCAGLDLTEVADPAMSERSAHALAGLYQAICASPLVTIAAAHGAAIGGGAGLIAACDLVVAADDLQIGFPEVRRGLVAALVTCLFRRQLGDRMLRELVLLGRSVDAKRALDLGLINQIAPAEHLSDAAIVLAFEACRGAPGAIIRTKRLLDDLSVPPITEALKLALQYHLAARDSAEAVEGVAAFHEKREPRWGPRQ